MVAEQLIAACPPQRMPVGRRGARPYRGVEHGHPTAPVGQLKRGYGHRGGPDQSWKLRSQRCCLSLTSAESGSDTPSEVKTLRSTLRTVRMPTITVDTA